MEPRNRFRRTQALDHGGEKEIADDHDARRRFIQEAEITSALEHPGIVPIYGLGTYDDGRPFYAMRFIQGGCLKEAILEFHCGENVKLNFAKKGLAFRKLLQRFIDVCEMMQYAHDRGVLQNLNSKTSPAAPFADVPLSSNLGFQGTNNSDMMRQLRLGCLGQTSMPMGG